MNMNAQVQAAYASDRRLVILRLLRQTGEGINTTVLTKGLQAIGHGYADRSMVIDDVRWLEQRGLVGTEELKSDLHMVTITGEGERVAEGKRRVAGIDRPSEA